MPDSPLIQALQDPNHYPDPADRVALVETHGAWVLLAGAHAYKIKKPVRLPFMDFGTLSARRAACEAEIRVNRRFEPADPSARLYLEALPITGTPDDPCWGGDPAQAIEWAVHMRRFPEADRLDHLRAHGTLAPETLRALARHLAGFQAGAATAGTASPWGRPRDVLAFARDNFGPLDTVFAGPTGTGAGTAHGLAAWTEATFTRVEPLLARRRREGRVREGHGDLHLANLVRQGDTVLPFDAIEFNDALRWIDVAADVAFTWMDLLRGPGPGLAGVLLSEWLDASGDTSAPAVLPFFAVYRALVRAKVAAIRLGQLPGGTAQADGARAEVLAYLRLAQGIAEPPPPRLVITHGLSGSGKSVASGHWLQADATGRAIRLRSDVERKRLHGLAALQASGSGLNSGLYAPQAHADTYASLRERAQALLADGWTVLVDAAFLRRHERQAFAALAQQQGCAFHILACEAPLPVLRERITERAQRGGDASEATLAVLEQQLGWLEPLDAAERATTWNP